jgi:hypothetical protein
MMLCYLLPTPGLETYCWGRAGVVSSNLIPVTSSASSAMEAKSQHCRPLSSGTDGREKRWCGD